MYSHDVTSIFTDILIQGELDCLEKRLHKFYYSVTEVEEILDSQIEGLGMNSLLSSLLCDIYVHCFEEKFFSVCIF